MKYETDEKAALRKNFPQSVFSGPYFPAIELNTKIYIEKLTRNLHRKIYQKNSEHGHFLRCTGCTVSKFRFFDLIQCMFKNQCVSGQQNTRKD